MVISTEANKGHFFHSGLDILKVDPPFLFFRLFSHEHSFLLIPNLKHGTPWKYEFYCPQCGQFNKGMYGKAIYANNTL